MSRARAKQSESCPMCGRNRSLTFHHIVPSALRKRRSVKARFSPEELQQGLGICRDCHNAVHHFISNKELSQRWHGLEELKAHPEIAKYIAWASKQDGRIRFG